MPISSTNLHTFTCSVCPAEKTKAGPLGNVQKDLIKEGWSFGDLTFGGNDYDLCPEHNKEMRVYFGIDSYPNNMFPNEAGA